MLKTGAALKPVPMPQTSLVAFEFALFDPTVMGSRSALSRLVSHYPWACKSLIIPTCSAPVMEAIDLSVKLHERLVIFADFS